MSDYAKKKNDELAALCKERGLAHTGKKAELVKRLEDHDSTSNTAPVSNEQPAVNGKEEAPATTSKGEPAQDATEAVPNTTESTEQTAETTDEKPAPPDFSLGLTERTLDEEIEKRKKRAAKFGLDTKDDETLRQLERAKRFGTNDLPGLLNQALPERAEKNKKRGREAKEEKEGRKRSRQRGPEESKKDEKATKPTKDGEHPSWMTDKDREAAEKRKARFNTAQ